MDRLAQAPDTYNGMVAIASVYRAILGGSRDHTLADDPALSYEDAAEVLLLLERMRQLEK